MFQKFFQKRVGKDIAKLEQARQRIIKTLPIHGLSEDEISQVESIAYKKASIAYMDNPQIQPALKIYFASIIEESLKLGYDVA